MQRILVVSDLHIGEAAHCATFKPKPKATDQDLGLLGSISHLAKIIGEPVDAVLFPGDLTNASQPNEIAKFDEVATEILKKFKLTENEAYVTLGNHDSDWHVQKTAPKNQDAQVYFERRYDHLKKSTVLTKILERSKGDLFSESYALWDDSILVLTVNTAHQERYSDKIKFGHVDRDLLEYIRAKHGNELKSSKIKVLLIHHHPIAYKNVLKFWKDHSQVQDAKLLMDFAEEIGFDLVVHGHRHAPDYASHLSDSAKQLICFCCGSFSARLSPYLTGEVTNQVHLIEVDGRNAEQGVVEGRIRSWAFTANKRWKESDYEKDGIEHEVRFGPLYHEAELTRILKGAVLDEIGKNKLAKLKDVVEASNVLRYARHSTLMTLLRSVAQEIGVEVLGDKPEFTVILPMVGSA